MGFKFGVLVGSGVGYVLGTRAGRERYDQIREQYQKLKGTGPAQKLTTEVQRLTDEATQTFEKKANETVDKVTGAAHEKLGSSDTPGSATTGTTGGSPTPGSI